MPSAPLPTNKLKSQSDPPWPKLLIDFITRELRWVSFIPDHLIRVLSSLQITWKFLHNLSWNSLLLLCKLNLFQHKLGFPFFKNSIIARQEWLVSWLEVSEKEKEKCSSQIILIVLQLFYKWLPTKAPQIYLMLFNYLKSVRRFGFCHQVPSSQRNGSTSFWVKSENFPCFFTKPQTANPYTNTHYYTLSLLPFHYCMNTHPWTHALTMIHTPTSTHTRTHTWLHDLQPLLETEVILEVD